MEHFTLPLDLTLIDDLTNINIDMSELNFDCPDDRKLRAAFIFIRNLDLDLNLDFSKCSYEMKEEFLLAYLKGDININIPIIRDTWIHILVSGYSESNDIDSILNEKELQEFYNKNKFFIYEINRLIASLTIMSVYQYSKSNANGANMITFDNQFEETNYDEINFNNFSFLTESPYFGFLFQNASRYVEPRFYNKYFKLNDQVSHVRINENLPIINLMNMLFAPKEIQDTFINELNKILEPEKEVNS